MKIVCLIRRSSPLYYFVNKINQEHGVSQVIVESPKKNKSKHTVSKLLSAAIRILHRLLHRDTTKQEDICNRWFGHVWRDLDESIPLIEVENVNSTIVVDFLKSLQPDLILVHGTSIVRKDVLSTSKLSLNLHWGLSPYYRGTHCTDWALINWDPINIGVTVHKLSNDIDGGDILAQKRANISENDTLFSINMQLTFLGVELINRVIQRMKDGSKLKFYEQNTEIGFLTYQKQWNFLLTKQIQLIERNNLMREILKSPAREVELPIVTFEED